MGSLYVLHDSSKELQQKYGAREVDVARARQLNAQGWGVFHAPNPFEGRRQLANLISILWWYCELDGGTKKEQVARLKASPLLPSWVVESKRGYHCYWRARGATKENWKRVVRWGIIPALGADPKAADVTRILRQPGFMHMKDPAHPFLVQTVWNLENSYSEAQLLRAFPSKEPKARLVEERELEPGEGTFWERVARLDAREAIRRLNGHWLQKGESFNLVEQANGNANVVRDDGHSTGVFVDREGRLGNVTGGSSIAAWAAWYGFSWAEIARGLKEIFAELEVP